MDTKLIQINLLPWRNQAKRMQKIQFFIILLINILLGLLVVFYFHYYVSYQVKNIEKENVTLTNLINSEKQLIAKYDKKEHEFTQVRNQLKFITGLYQENNLAIDILNELIQIVPQNIYLAQINRMETNIFLMGYAANDEDVLSFVQALTKSKLFVNPVLNAISQPTDSLKSNEKNRLFDIKLALRP